MVIATGPFQVPFVPPDRRGPRCRASCRCTAPPTARPDSVPDGRVLVVGGGNTGFQIAEELSASREVHLSIGSRQTPLPQRVLGRDLFWYLDTTGLIRKPTDFPNRPADAEAGGHADRLESASRTSARDRAPRPSRRCGGIDRQLRDGAELDVGGVIWATGFRVDHSWIDVPVFDENGRAVHERGVTASPGLYFLGQLWQHTRGSALLGWVKDDAAYLAEKVAAFRSNRHRPPRTEMQERNMSTTPDHFPTDVEGLPEAQRARAGRALRRRRVRPPDRAGREAHRRRHRADAGLQRLDPRARSSRCEEGSEIVVNIENQGDMEATVHWHGLRLENRYDGTHETQAPIEVGERFSARVTFPDPGAYWYHPHIREDYGQELGLYGNCLVVPSGPGLLAAREPGHSADARRHSARGRQGRPLQPHGDDLRGDGALRRGAAGQRRDRPVAGRAARRGRAPLLHEHRKHPHLQGRAAGRTHEARRRRQRPRRARGVRRGRRPRPVRARRRRRAVRQARRPDARAPHAGPRLPAGRHPRERRARSSLRSRSSSKSSARTPTWSPSASGSLPTSTPSRTRRSASSPRWTWRPRRARRVGLRLPDASGGGQRRAGPLPEVRDEAAAVAPGRLRVPDASEVVSDEPATARSAR